MGRGGKGRGDGGAGGGGGNNGGGGGGKGGNGGGSTPGNSGAKRGGAGRGIPDFKDNTGGRIPGQEDMGQVDTRFNSQEAADWISARYQTVMEDFEKQKQSGNKKGDIQSSADLNAERPAWGAGAKPVIPPKEDFLYQLQSALMQLRGRPSSN
eukprot:TRINITY_DN28013_c0_g1_i1.p1 TRINITY_DN28013_c0_g1~~TRINITY_DN28013_c0_g1_i1.p1  ORF type:complete len:153 (+),score=45.47 TRINITY_DN28013_c0_g1_i1:56-514(+)